MIVLIHLGLRITEINYPFSQSHQSSNFGASWGGRFTFYDEEGNITQNQLLTPNNYWRAQRKGSLATQINYDSIRFDINPSQTSFTSSLVEHPPSSTSYGRFTLFADEEEDYQSSLYVRQCAPKGVFGMIISKYDDDGNDNESFIRSLSHGDIIEFDHFISTPPPLFVNDNIKTRYQILRKPIPATFFDDPSKNGNHFVIRLQYIFTT
jgi:hypothetical protein